MLAGLASVLSVSAVTLAQGAAGTPAQAPLQMSSLDSATKADPFPPVNPKYFTATTPTVATVDGFLKSLWGYDSNRIWRVEAIEATPAPGVSKVVVFVSDRGPNAKVQTTAFFVTPDGNHALTGDAVVPFGATPFAETRKMIQARADGASRGAASKDFMLVEFADLQCPHCKDAQGTMDQIVKDFPNARVVYQSFPLVEIHPFAFKAAAYGYCVQKQKNDAFFTYAAAVFAYAGGADCGDWRCYAEGCGDEGWAGSGGRRCLRCDAGYEGPGECFGEAGGGCRGGPDTDDRRSTGMCCRWRGFRMRR